VVLVLAVEVLAQLVVTYHQTLALLVVLVLHRTLREAQ
jgi:hypothetical protein